MSGYVFLEQRIADALEADAAIRGICDMRIFPLKIPQGRKIPAIVYQRVSTSPDFTLQGYTSEDVLIMINSFSMVFAEAKDLSRQVRRVIAASPLNGLLNDEKDVLNETGEVFCISAQYRFQQTGGFCYG